MKNEARREQRSDALTVETKRRRALAVDDQRPVDLAEFGFAEAWSWLSRYVEETSVGRKTDLPQAREILEPPAHVEVASVVDDRFGPESSSLLVVLLDSAGLVVDVQRRECGNARECVWTRGGRR